MAATVYFADVRTRKHSGSKLAKIARLCDALELKQILQKDEQTAVKLHFGEYGNDTHLNPVLVRAVIDKIKQAGAKPFLTDTCTLYSGHRRYAVDHLHIAYAHGFVPYVVDAPAIIADGLTGENDKDVSINGKHFASVHIAAEIAAAPAMVVLSHFKGHEMAGFGGAIKNLAMGCASVRGKREQHGTTVQWDEKDCIHCKLCIAICPQEALSLGENDSIVVDAERCVGCFECITVCQPKALSINWLTEIPAFMERLTEYAYGAVKEKAGRVVYINFLLNVTPDCDCAGWSDMPLIGDVGILASADPVALDQACFDMVQQAKSLRPELISLPEEKMDKFTAHWPNTRGSIQLSYGEEIGLGTREYTLKKI